MKIIGLKRLDDFCGLYPECRGWLSNWESDVRNSSWKNPHEVKQRYSTVSFLGKGVAIFNVKGNNFRLEVMIAYNTGIVSIKWIGTHAEYTERFK